MSRAYPGGLEGKGGSVSPRSMVVGMGGGSVGAADGVDEGETARGLGDAAGGVGACVPPGRLQEVKTASKIKK